MGYLENVKETQHGQRARLLFFLDCLKAYAGERGVPPTEVSVLDIGCGNGQLISLPVGEAGYQVTGIDLHEPSIAWGRAANTLDNVRFVLGDVTNDLPSGERYDVAILSDILEHLEEPAQLLLAVRERLRPGGMVLISIPNGYGPFEIENFLIRIGALKPFYWLALKLAAPFRKGDNPPFNADSGHVQWFTKKRFTALLRETGFEVTRFRKGAVSSGDFTGLFVRRIPALMRLGVRAAQHLPHYVSSVWHWEARLRPNRS